MRVSPIQLQLYLLTKVSVVPIERPGLTPGKHASGGPVDWDAINFATDIEFGWADDQKNDPRAFAMRVELKVDNKEGKPSPYIIDLGVIGYFTLLGDIPLHDRENLAKVNGASLLYGVLREVVFMLTARFPSGPAILPSMNFLDLKTVPPTDPVVKAEAAKA